MRQQLSQQAIDEVREVLVKHLPEYLGTGQDDLELVNLDVLCAVKDGESLEFVTLCLNSQLLKRYQAAE